MSSEIKRQDIIDDDALAAPQVLAENLKAALDVVKQIHVSAKKMSATLSETGSTKKTADAVNKLTLEQQELFKIQNQIAITVSKNNDAYREHVNQLNKVKQSLKEKIALGERDALTINRQNASIEELGAALNKNRVAFAKLRTEEERNSKAGKELLRVIQQQDKEYKELRQSIGQAQDNVGNYASAIEGLDGVIGGTIGNVQALGKQLLQLVSNPVILALGILIGLISAVTNSVKTFWATTGEGEDQAARQTAVWSQFFNVLRTEWSNLGKAISNFFEETGGTQAFINGILTSTKDAFPFLSSWLSVVQAKFNLTAKEAENLADKIDDIDTRRTRNIVTSAETERKYNELILKSQDKLYYSDELRLQFLQQAVELKREQLAIDLQIAKDNADAVLRQIALEHALTEEKVKSMTFEKMDAEFNAEEMERIAEAKAEAIRLEANYAAEVKKSSKQIIALQMEIRDAAIAFQKEFIQMAKDAANERVTEEQNAVNKMIAEEKRLLVTRLQNTGLTELQRRFLIEESEKEVERIRREGLVRTIRAEMAALDELAKVMKLSPEEQEKFNQKKLDLDNALNTALHDNEKARQKESIEATKQFIAELTQIYQTYVGAINGFVDAIYNNRLYQMEVEEHALQEQYDRDIERLDRRHEHELELAGDNAKRKNEIDTYYNKQKQAIEEETARKTEELERRKIILQRRYAIFDKATSAVQAAINTALAVTNQLRSGDPYTAFARALAAGIAGGIQVATILAKPIPQYEVGAKPGEHPGGLAVVGERGAELMITPSGKVSLSPSSATVVDLPKGTEVIPHEETMRRLAISGISGSMADNNSQNNSAAGWNIVGKKLDSLENTIRNKKEFHVVGPVTGFTSGGNRTAYIDSLRKRK